MDVAKAYVPTNRYKCQFDRACVKAELVRLYNAESFGSSNILAAKHAFISEYNQGAAGKYAKLYAIIGPASFKSFERWKLKLKRSRGRPTSLIDSRGMGGGCRRNAIRHTRRTASRILGVIAKVPARSRPRWFAFLDALKKGQSPEEIARSVGIHTSTVRKWIKNLAV
jgi:hypothetical protein